MARSLKSRKADAQQRKFRREKKPTLQERAILLVREAFRGAGDAPHLLFAAARALIREGLRVAK